MRRAKTSLGACLSLIAGTTVPAEHPSASPFATRVTTTAMPTMVPPTFDHDPDGAPIAPTDARARIAVAFNATVPLANGMLVPARPFTLQASNRDLARAIDCLAAAGYYEAGGGLSDQRAVAQVVLNRVRHRAFTATVCGVVFQGSERRTGCQFTFTCDGSMLRRTPSPEAWERARRMAAEMLMGYVEPEVGLATHYHTDWVSPYWDRTMDKIAIVRTHLFYRWRGQQTFDVPYAGNEPDIPLLARLSGAHRSGPDAGPGAQFVPVVAVEPPPSIAAAPPVARAPDPPPNIFFLTLPAGGSPASFRALAEQRCAGLSPCRVMGWTDAARTPHALPMPGSSVDTLAFVFERRGASSPDQARWDCDRFAPEGARQCI